MSENKVIIDVENFKFLPSFFAAHKIKLIIILSSILVVVSVPIIIIVTKKPEPDTTIPTKTTTTDYEEKLETINPIKTNINYYEEKIDTTIHMKKNTIDYEEIETTIPKIIPLKTTILEYSDKPTTEADEKLVPISAESSIICEPGYTLENNECILDYFIKAIYFSNENDTVRLISDKYNLTKIKRITIDNEIITPT